MIYVVPAVARICKEEGFLGINVAYLRDSGAHNTVTDCSVSGVKFFYLNFFLFSFWVDIIPDFCGKF